jgi:hypothetical protein
MADEQHLVDFPRLRNLIEKFRNKAYRDTYVAGHTRRFLARQMRKFRGDVSQAEFGDLIGKRQTVVSRLEDPKYGKWTLQTLFDVASKLNVAVIVRFVDIPTFLKLSEDMSDEASCPQPYDEAGIASAFEPKKVIIKSPQPDEPIPVFGVGSDNQLVEIVIPKGEEDQEINKQKQSFRITHNAGGGEIILQ